MKLLLLCMLCAPACIFTIPQDLDNLYDYVIMKAMERTQAPQLSTACVATNPCQNGARCSTAEMPLLEENMDYYCLCLKGTGGFHCEIKNPCDYCPKEGLNFCWETNVKKKGQLCFDHNNKVMPVDETYINML